VTPLLFVVWKMTAAALRFGFADQMLPVTIG
jgi:hypothetical protein